LVRLNVPAHVPFWPTFVTGLQFTWMLEAFASVTATRA
jgi:hypothetical protein